MSKIVKQVIWKRTDSDEDGVSVIMYYASRKRAENLVEPGARTKYYTFGENTVTGARVTIVRENVY